LPKWFYWKGKTLHLHVYLQPRAKNDGIVGIHDDCIKIRITAPPIEGRANLYLTKLLARYFKVPEQRVIISQGDHSRKKWLTIDNPADLSLFEQYFHEDSAS
jgi:uncharacterized protein